MLTLLINIVRKETIANQPLKICISSAQPIGTIIDEDQHKPFKASACPIEVSVYDESQMMDNDVIRHQQRSEIEYDC